jgi:pyruvate,water dikinase
VGSAVSSGRAKILADPSEIEQFGVGDLLVTERTDPDWEPILKRASGVITNQGGRTCHAAIIAREMGITAIVGTGDATSRIADGETITASCAEGDEGRVYRGALAYRLEELPIEALPPCPVMGWGWPGWNSSSPTTSRCIRWRCCNPSG